ncbi:MAG TPA: hypothetical protein VFK89_10920 [Actinomycetota bacterium]|nr:hypothetical protein [Actinomycetota bacterium]
MTRRRWVLAGGVAAVMFAAGALLPLRAHLTSASSRPPRVAPQTLTPVGGALSLDATIESLQERLRRHRDPAGESQLGLAYLQKGRLGADPSYFPKAGRLFRLSLRGDPSNVDALIGRGLLANARHRFAEGLRWGHEAAMVSPYSADALGVVVDSLVELGRYRAATGELQHMVDLKPNLASFARISYLRELEGDGDGAIQAMHLALRATQETGEDHAWVLCQLGDLYYAHGRYAQAKEEYRAGHAAAPDYYVPLVGLAKFAAAEGRLGDAVRKMRRVVAVYPSAVNVILLGDLYSRLGNDEQADAQYALVEAQRRLAEANGVVTDVELTVFYADHHRRIGRTVALARAQYDARDSIRTADALAWALYSAGRYHEAITYARRAARLGTRDALLYYHRGAIELALGHERVAAQLLSRALELNPHFSVLQSGVAHELLQEARR